MFAMIDLIDFIFKKVLALFKAFFVFFILFSISRIKSVGVNVEGILSSGG